MTESALTAGKLSRETSVTDWLTVERAAYAGLAIVALGVRLWGLGATALGPEEAAQALPALAAAQGNLPDLAGVSPLLHALQRITFGLFPATDAAARFWPALVGGLSVLLFYALRDRLTPGGALVAAALWALSPLAVWSSRLAVGDAFVPAAALALLATINGLAAGRGAARTVALAGVALAALLLSGPAAYTAIAAGLVALAWWRGSLADLWAQVRAHRRVALVSLLGTLLLGATFFTLTPAGLAAAWSLLGDWLAGLLPGSGEYGAWEQARRLLISEPLLLAFGVVGLIQAWRRGDRAGRWLGFAAAVALLPALVGRGRHPLDLVLVTLVLALLAGPAVARVLVAAWSDRRQADTWLLLAFCLAFLFSASIALPSAANPANRADWRSLYIGVGVGTSLLAVLVWLAYGVLGSWDVVARAWPVIPLALGLAWGGGQVAALSYDRGAWRQSAALHEVAATDTVDLQRTLRDLSALHGGGTREAKIDLVWPERQGDPMLPTLRWQLRDYPNLRVAASMPSDPAPLVFTPVAEQPRLADRYSGAEFAVLQRWRPAGFESVQQVLRWLLYRETRTAPEKIRAILWKIQP